METKRDFDLMALYTKFKNIATKGPADEETVLKIVAEILDILPKADKYIVDMEEELEDNTPHLDRRVINKFESITGKKLSNIELFTEDSYSIYEGHIDGLIKNLDALARVYANRHINYIEKENDELRTKYEKLFANQCKGTPGVNPNKKEETNNSSPLAKHQYYIRVYSDPEVGSNIIHSCINSEDKVISIFDSYCQSQCQILRNNTYISIIVEKDPGNRASIAQVFNKYDELLGNLLSASDIMEYISKL